MFLIIFLTLFSVIVVWTWWAGFWANILLFVNMLLGGLVASAFFLNIARLILTADPTFSNLSPFLAFWGLFFLAVGGFRGCTDTFSHYRLKFDLVTEMFGRSLMSMLNGFLFCTIAAFSVHLAPLPKFYFPDDQESVMGIEKPWNYGLGYFSGYSLSESVYYCISDPTAYWDEADMDEDKYDPNSDYSMRLSVHYNLASSFGSNQYIRYWVPEELYSRLNVRSSLEGSETLRLAITKEAN